MASQKTANIVGGKSPNRSKAEHDYHATNPIATNLLLDRELLYGDIWECACGEGHMSKVIKERYPTNNIFSTDLIDRGYADEQCNFLNCDYTADTIITNPPFSLLNEFITVGLEKSNKKLILLGRIQALEGQKRSKILKNSPLKHIYVFSKRISLWRNGNVLDEKGKPWSGVLAFAWFVWEHGYEGEPIVRWI